MVFLQQVSAQFDILPVCGQANVTHEARLVAAIVLHVRG